MKIWGMAGLALALVAGAASGADYQTLRHLEPPPPVVLQPLASGEKAQPVKLAKVVIHPRDGEPWAVVYSVTVVQIETNASRTASLVPWKRGRIETDDAALVSAFDEELVKAGFKASSSESLFGDNGGSYDLQVGVLIDDIKGRICVDCPNPFMPKAPGAVITMNARWEVYSAVQGRVVAKASTTGGGLLTGSATEGVEPALYAAFRENVRQLLASEEFRKVVTAGATAPQVRAPATPMSFTRSLAAKRSLSTAPSSVVAVFAGDSMGSGFLISPDGLVLTNHHVVGAAPKVRIRWSDRSESVGEVLRSDVRRDVALIKVDPHGRAALPLRTAAPEAGETVFAIGMPLEKDFQNTLTKGVVSAVRMHEGQRFIQSDVAVDHGNSGGPLLDENGQVVGITDWGYAPDGISHNLNFFIPIDDALRILALSPAAEVQATAEPRAARAHRD
ncbi:hypothetical protein DJ021_09505 [Phenylobacterium hankyongense]|uniref:Serine protease n=1 Tax=Phenylobacterium hankyongense TaxID=1813876 RepID=A0A328AY30_9CAUL|nr:trypsin-like peptidase domain-containing protein [Phenylobacterium hankyongense]RAK60022.1 hypothetical protein DJ021_09505 [Phenylobacterium hankyongense]